MYYIHSLYIVSILVMEETDLEFSYMWTPFAILCTGSTGRGQRFSRSTPSFSESSQTRHPSLLQPVSSLPGRDRGRTTGMPRLGWEACESFEAFSTIEWIKTNFTICVCVGFVRFAKTNQINHFWWIPGSGSGQFSWFFSFGIPPKFQQVDYTPDSAVSSLNLGLSITTSHEKIQRCQIQEVDLLKRRSPESWMVHCPQEFYGNQWRWS